VLLSTLQRNTFSAVGFAVHAPRIITPSLNTCLLYVRTYICLRSATDDFLDIPDVSVVTRWAVNKPQSKVLHTVFTAELQCMDSSAHQLRDLGISFASELHSVGTVPNLRCTV
jgi:hypothetical protein